MKENENNSIEKEQPSENVKLFGEKMGDVLDLLDSGEYDTLPPEEKKKVLKDYYRGLNDVDNKHYPMRETIDQNLEVFLDTPLFDRFADKVVNSDLKGEHLGDVDLMRIMGFPVQHSPLFLKQETAGSEEVFTPIMERLDQKVTEWCKPKKIKWTPGKIKKEENEEAGPENNKARSSKADVMKAKYWIDALDKADPFWMTSSSKEYSDIQKALKKLQDHEKQAKKMGILAKDYVDYTVKHLALIENVKLSVRSYLDYKEDQFRTDPARRDSADKQKREQKRLLTVLNLLEGMEATKDQIIANGKKNMDRMKNDFALSKFKNYDETVYDFFEKLKKNHAEHFRNTQLEELQHTFLSVQTKMAIGYAPKSEQRAEAYRQQKEAYEARLASEAAAKNKKPAKQAAVKQ